MAYSYVQYVGNGSSVTYAVTFPYLSTAHVEVRVNNVLKTQGVDYTWTTSSTITFNTAPATGLTVDIRRKSSPSTRLVDFQDGSTLTQDVLDTDSNQNFYLAQESFDATDQRLPLDTDGQWTGNNRRIKNIADPVNAQDVATKNYADTGMNSQLVIATTQASNAAASAATATTKATAAGNSATAAASSASSAATSATNAATSATNAATSATTANNWAEKTSGTVDGSGYSAKYWATQANVGTVATNITNINAVGNNIANVNAVANNATNINEVNANKTNINAVVANSSNINAVANNATNINAVNGNKAHIDIVAGSNSDVTTVAASISSVNQVATNSGSVSTVATNISSVNTAATNIAAIQNASSNASSAATSATNAASSAASALSTLNTFKGQYLGSLSTPPSVDSLGNAVDAGDLYYDTNIKSLRVFDGTSWINPASNPNTSVKTQEFTATASQTTFTVTGGYTVGQIQVFKNGSKLKAADFTATNGITVVLGTGASAGDIVFVIAFMGTLITTPPFVSASSDEFTSATAYDQTVKMNIGGKPYYMNNVAVAPTVDFKFGTTKNLQNAADNQTPATFTRASSATYMDASGVMQTAGSGVARFTHDPANSNASLGLLVEPQRTNLVLDSAGYDKQNLFTYSGTFDNAAWTAQGASVTAAHPDPFGGTAAYKLTENTTTSSQHRIYQAPTVTASVPYVISVYAKKAERSWLFFYWNAAPTTIGYFDLNNGVVGGAYGTIPPTNLSIISVGNGWYRCSMVITPNTATPNWSIGVTTADNTTTYAGTVGSGIYIYGAQVERSYSTTPSAYYATTSAAYQPWVAVQTTLTPSAGTAPDGTNSAYKVVAVSGQTLNNSANNLRTSALTLTTGSPYTISVYAKAAGYNKLNLRFSNVSTLATTVYGAAYFNLSTGSLISTAVAGYNASIQSVGNGWYRCSITGVPASATMYAGIYNDDSSATTADGTSGILLWGFQVEQADSASTYIPTTTAQVTRAADVLALADSGWLNQTEGTFYVDRKLRGVSNNQTLFSLDNGTSDIDVRTVAGTNSVNLLTYSEQFDTAAWSKVRATVSQNVTTAPDGTSIADKLVVDNTANNSHFVYQTITYNAGSTYTLSVYAKAGEWNYVIPAINAAPFGLSGTVWAIFDLTNGTVGTTNNSPITSITSVGNGWYRCSITKSATTTVAAQTSIQLTNSSSSATPSGDGTSGIYIWGAQLEASSSVSTYEPNPKYLTSYEIGSDGLIQTSNYASIDIPNLYQKSTFGYKANDATYYRSGSSVGTDTSVTLPTTMNRLVIGGSGINSGREINGTIKRLTYWPLRLTNTSQSTITS